MECTTIHGYGFSKLSLGTVQLGIPYGISNTSGKPSTVTAREIMQAAIEAGITTFDTSATYGTAEEEIGKYFSNGMAHPKPIIVTKFKIGPTSYDTRVIREEIHRSVHSSLQKLKLKKIPVYLFHKDKFQELERLIEPMETILEELKTEGLVDIAGISASGPEDVNTVLDHDILQAVQIPLNVFDQRLIHSGQLDELRKKNKIVFARSVFLQGLFFMQPGELPQKLAPAKKFLSRLYEIAGAVNLQVPQLAFSYVRHMMPVTSIVFGAVSKTQVSQNLEFLGVKALPHEVMQLVHEAFADVPEMIITPAMW